MYQVVSLSLSVPAEVLQVFSRHRRPDRAHNAARKLYQDGSAKEGKIAVIDSSGNPVREGSYRDER